MIIEGESNEASVLVSYSEQPMFLLNQVINTEFLNIGFTSKRSVSVRLRSSFTTSTQKGVLFNWAGKGGDRFLRFTNLYIENFEAVWNISEKGRNTHSEVIYTNCVILNCGTVLKLNNPQSVNHTFLNCNVEGTTDAVFDVYKGGYVNVIGGSYISKGDFLKFEGDQGGLGRYNNHFFIQNVKFEMGSKKFNRDPYLINCIRPVRAKIVFSNVNNLADANPDAIYFKLRGYVDLSFEYSQMTGIIDDKGNSVQVNFSRSTNLSRLNR